MQKKGIVVVAIAVLLMAGLTACKRGGIPCQNCENYATIQGTIMDAVTGERIGGTMSGKNQDMEIYLIQGSTIRTPTSFISDAGNSLVGEYSFTNVPAGGTHNTGYDPNDSENNEYKMVVIKNGYQRFEGKVNLVDIDNKICNIYLFPDGYHAPDYTFQVVYNGAPIDNATVLFKPVVGSNLSTTETSDVLAATTGYLPSLIGFTDAEGRVTFSGSKLQLGAAYKVVVLPTKFEGVPLAYYEDIAARIIGIGNTTDIIGMGDLVYGNAYGLYVVSISNSIDDQTTSSGILTVTFSRPVAFSGDFTMIFNSTGGTLSSITSTLSADGLTLTITPNWDPADPPGTGMISYGDGSASIMIPGYPLTDYDLFDLVDASGAGISNDVYIEPTI